MLHTHRRRTAIVIAFMLPACTGHVSGDGRDAADERDATISIIARDATISTDAPDAAMALDASAASIALDGPDAAMALDASAASLDATLDDPDAPSRPSVMTDDANDALATMLDASAEAPHDDASPACVDLDRLVDASAAQNDGGRPLVTDVVINEINLANDNWEDAGSQATSQSTYVELYNTGAARVDLSCWKLDNGNPWSPQRYHVFPPGTIIEPGAFLATTKVLVREIAGFLGASLLDAQGRRVSNLSWYLPNAMPPVTWGDCPDGRGYPGQPLSTATPGAPNHCPD